MINETSFPTIEYHLPEMMAFVSGLVQDFQSGDIRSWETITERTQSFFSSDMLDKIEAIAPGWRDMASYANGMTLVHVICVFTGLLLCPEFEQASNIQRELMKWIVLFHDIAKEVRNRKGDRVHGFRSAAKAGATLPEIGFAATAEYDSFFDEWFILTNTAITKGGETSVYIQDNRKLPEIIAGIDRLFGYSTPAALIIKTVLLHMSLTVVEDYPTASPLTEIEIRQYLDNELFPLLKMMMLVDSDGWELFRQPIRERYRQETLAVFERLESIVAT